MHKRYVYMGERCHKKIHINCIINSSYLWEHATKLILLLLYEIVTMLNAL